MTEYLVIEESIFAFAQERERNKRIYDLGNNFSLITCSVFSEREL